MCPILPLLLADSSDEIVVTFLDSRSVDDPVPSNVIIDVDPFTVDPRFSSDDNWYLHKSIIKDNLNERSIIKGNSGHWEFINNISISMPTITHTIGRKITRKFLLGNGISGDETTIIMMHEYLVGSEKNKLKENSLSRIFKQTDEVKNVEESGTGGENTESKLPFLVNQEERNSSLKQRESEFQLNESPNDLMNVETGLEDFIELKDLFDAEDGNSSFSSNTSVKSMTSDENFESETMGFDPEAMISDIANDVNNVNASVSSERVAIQPPLSPDAPVPHVARKGKSEVSSSSSSESSGDHTSSKQSGIGSSYKRVKSRSARRMAKLGKRYCCFIE